MFRRIVLAVMMVAMIAGGGALLGLPPVAAQADPSATRSFSPAEVGPGGEVVVSITADNYGTAGAVTEMLPAGFTYVSSTLPNNQVSVTGQQARFTLFGDASFTYTVTASSEAGSYTFSGTLRDFDAQNHDVGGAFTVTVVVPQPGATRTFNPATVAPGGQVVVSITAINYGLAGGVTEMLPEGFTYVSSSLPESRVNITGQQARFTLLEGEGDPPFTYTVTASSDEGSYTFSGALRDFDEMNHTVGGSAMVTVQSAAPPPPPPPPPPPTPPDQVGTVSFSMDMPKVGAALTATLSDPDGGVTGTTWQWARSDTMDGTYTNIATAASASYTPVDDDVDKYLKAMASYTDTHRPNRTAEAMTANAVGSATPATGSALGDQYDSVANGGNGDGQLDTPEMLKAVRDYFAQGSTITVPQMLELVRIYFAS